VVTDAINWLTQRLAAVAYRVRDCIADRSKSIYRLLVRAAWNAEPGGDAPLCGLAPDCSPSSASKKELDLRATKCSISG
jgi:hypothetical protein